MKRDGWECDECGKAIRKLPEYGDDWTQILTRVGELVVSRRDLCAACRRKGVNDSLVHLRSEVNCRIEHGAESGGHLEYVQSKLDEILGELA